MINVVMGNMITDGNISSLGTLFCSHQKVDLPFSP